jgi:hypothetical protein
VQAEPDSASAQVRQDQHHGRFDVRAAYRHHFADPRRERAFLHAVAFTAGFAGCRITTHAIRNNWGPFRNMSVGGRHLHHSTFGIIGQIGVGYLWTYRLGVGDPGASRTASRASAISSGLATALTLDEFALWFDLADDYWTTAGRKSIDAVAMFGGLSAISLSGHGMIRECGRAFHAALRRVGHRGADQARAVTAEVTGTADLS